MNFCSRDAQAQAAPLAGTGVRGDAYLFVPVAKQLWGSSGLNTDWASPETVQQIDAARRSGVVTRLYHPGRAADAPVLVFHAPGSATSETLQALLRKLSRDWVLDETPEPRLAICTHGTRDRCCAKFGFAAVREAQRLFDAGRSAFQPLECSHLGGDRFAATGIFFPSGSMYAHLDSADLQAIAAAEAAGTFVPENYRGRVFEDALEQVVRAGLARDGFGAHATAPVLILEHGSATEARVRATVQGEPREFAVELELVEADFFSNCSAMDAGRRARGRRLAYVRATPV